MGWFIKKKRQPGWLALGLHQDRVDLVHIRRQPTGRPEVTLCDSYRTEESNVATLARLRKELKLEQYHCTTLLASEHYQLHQIDAPNVPPAEIKTAVRWRVKDLIEYSLESATVDVLDIPADPNAAGRGHSVYAVTARSRAVDACVRPFSEAHIKLDAVDIPDLAQRNIAALLEPEGQGVAMLGFYPHEGILTFTAGGEIYVARRIDVLMSQLSDPDTSRRKEHFERIRMALQRSIDYFERQCPHITVAKLLLGPLPADVGLARYLAADTPIPIESIDLATILDFPAVPELKHAERQSQCLQTIGAALRLEEGARP